MPLFVASNAPRLDLAGAWELTCPTHPQIAGSIRLPGSLTEQGFGLPVTLETPWTGSFFDPSYFTAPEYAAYREPGQIKVPFWLQPDRHFTGVAHYRRTFKVHADQAGLPAELFLERPHWQTTVWLDGQSLGSQDSLSTPHLYPLGRLTPGEHELLIAVDNSRLRVDLGENSHSISDHTQGNWNGIVGEVSIRFRPRLHFADLQVFCQEDPDDGYFVEVSGTIGGLKDRESPRIQVKLQLRGEDYPDEADGDPDGYGNFLVRFSLENACEWNEFTPAVHHVTATIRGGEAVTLPFGVRTVACEGRQLVLNGRPLCLRGALDCAVFPLTGFPPTDRVAWEREFRVIQSYGLNHVRFHSWCPPEVAFAVADELGLYLQVEVASWPNQSITLGDGHPVDAWLEAETGRILAAYGHHPSFLILAACNEPGGEQAAGWLDAWIRRWKQADQTSRLFTAGAGWPETPANDFHIRSEPRIQHWEEGLASRINALPPETASDYRDFIQSKDVPVVSHEIGQWCVYPHLAERAAYTGLLKAKNFDIFADRLAENHLADQAEAFFMASGKLQALCYKEEIEAALRTPEMGGFQLLGLGDFPGQGTALVGVVDPFWNEKPYISPKQFARFCGPTVPLARLKRRVFVGNDTLEATFEVAHFAKSPVWVTPLWRLETPDGDLVGGGHFAPQKLELGHGNVVGEIRHTLSGQLAPGRLRLILELPEMRVANDWDIWVYPIAVPAAPAGLHVTPVLDEAAQAVLAAGGTVWWQIPPAQVAPDPQRGPIALGFSTVFWNTAWTNRQAPHTLGILCDPAHPALARFPTESHSNWQWWPVVTAAAPLLLTGLPPEVRPLVQLIDDWFTARRLGLVIEAQVGPGRILVSSIDFGDGTDPVRRQLRHSLAAYLGSRDFAPKVPVTVEALAHLARSAESMP